MKNPVFESTHVAKLDPPSIKVSSNVYAENLSQNVRTDSGGGQWWEIFNARLPHLAHAN